MQEFLALSREDQKLAIEQTGARNGCVASSAEKDFWVCWTLERLFALPELKGHLTFKEGGGVAVEGMGPDRQIRRGYSSSLTANSRQIPGRIDSIAIAYQFRAAESCASFQSEWLRVRMPNRN